LTFCCCSTSFLLLWKKSNTLNFILLVSCPQGRAWADKAHEDNQAHAYAECSNMGRCNRNTVSLVNRLFRYWSEYNAILLIWLLRVNVNVIWVLKALHVREVSIYYIWWQCIHLYVTMDIIIISNISATCNCGDHGQCLTIKNLNMFHGNNNFHYNLWESNKMTACVCDIGIILCTKFWIKLSFLLSLQLLSFQSLLIIFIWLLC
jgi:hypothetical protein